MKFLSTKCLIFVLFSALVVSFVVAGCADETTEPTRSFDDLGTIVFLDVTDENGERPAEFHAGHPVRVTVGIDPTEGAEERLQGLEHNMHIGLITKLDSGQSMSDADTCYIGQLFDPHFGFHVVEDGSIEFVSEHLIPETCLGDEDSDVFNFWIAINPARTNSSTTEEDISPDDHNTQFFMAQGFDSEGQDLHEYCHTVDGQSGCVIDATISRSPGHNVELRSSQLASNVFVFDPEHCQQSLSNELKNLFDTQTLLRIHGSDHHDGENTSHSYSNALEPLLADGEAVELVWDLCPRADDGGCIEGEQPIDLGVASVDSEGLLQINQSHGYTEMVAGRDHIGAFDVHIDPETPACDFLTPVEGEDWSDYQMFNLRTCAVVPFEEDGHGETEEDDNCVTNVVRMVIAETSDQTAASSLQWVYEWARNPGNSIVNLDASFGLENRLNLSGAYSRTYAQLSIGGWLSISIIDLNLEARAWVSLVGSGIETHIDIFGVRLWGYDYNVNAVDVSGDYSFSRSYCVSYNYGIAGIGLNASLCASGEAGLETAASVDAQEAGDENPPFDDSTRIGVATGNARPYANFALTASAYLDVAISRGGISGTLTLIDAELPAELGFQWGLIDGPALVVTYDVYVPFHVTLLTGRINVWVDLARPGWCGWLPCRKWRSVVDRSLVSFTASRLNYRFWDTDGTLTLR